MPKLKTKSGAKKRSKSPEPEKWFMPKAASATG